jgi:hypothetical protein
MSPDGTVIKSRVEKYALVRRFNAGVEITLAVVTPPPGGGTYRRLRGFLLLALFLATKKKSHNRHPGVAFSFDRGKMI